MPGTTTAHIINHTHWDREWFLTSEYTSRWIPRLIDRLEQNVDANSDYRYFLDGQTLVVEDLLDLAPEYETRVRRLVAAGNLTVGPYYCQPDWRLAGGELLLRNLRYGLQDARHYGSSSPAVGWLVDTFGHVGQAPQIHRLFGIDAVYVWRGVPVLEPYFIWAASDGSKLFTINLFGGYRNLYGVTHAPEVAVPRLRAELRKLGPYYPTPDVPLFDGYDLEDDPEDPVRFYQETQEVSSGIALRETTPSGFAHRVVSQDLSLPTVSGELNSGKYGATFPGTLTARTYLKLMAHDCERLLFQLAEPLAVLAHLRGRPYDEPRYERWCRLLLQNAVHDCLCGVSIDQVHEKMEYSYLHLAEAMKEDISASLPFVMSGFAAGDYAISTNACSGHDWQIVGNNELVHLQSQGVGIWPVAERWPVQIFSERVESFTWRNDHYEASVGDDGTVRLGNAMLGRLVVGEELGDTYSAEPGRCLGVLRPDSALRIVRKNDRYCELNYRATWRDDDRSVTADVFLRFDPSPLVRWEVELDSCGDDLRVDAIFETGRPGDVYAAMPFDLVPRPLVDRDLLPRTLPTELAGVLLGQRELNGVSLFPFRDFVLSAAADDVVAIFSKGTRAYRAGKSGTITLPLRRTVEWLTRVDLNDRVGDAGPFFYVPGARCERWVRHEFAVAAGPYSPGGMELQRLNAFYQNPPLVVQVAGEGERTEWQLLHEELPLSALYLENGALHARFYNPLPAPQSFRQEHRQASAYSASSAVGRRSILPETVKTVPPGKIITVRLPCAPAMQAKAKPGVALLTRLGWRIGPDEARPDSAVLAELQTRIHRLGAELEVIARRLDAAEGADRLRLQHRSYVLEREQLEYQLSLLLNRRKRAQTDRERYFDDLYMPDPEVAAVGAALNRLRIKRRVYDYVVQAIQQEM